MGHGVDTCRLVDIRVMASGQIPQSFGEWLGEANDQMLLKSKSKVRRLQDIFWTLLWGRHDLIGGAGVWRASSRESRCPPDVIPTAAILDDAIQDGGGGNDVIQDLGYFFHCLLQSAEEDGGPSASGRHLGWPHLLRNWTGNANEVIQDGDQKRNGRHLLLHSEIGCEKSTLNYFNIG